MATCISAHPGQIDGVKFEEVSLGYPKQWNQSRGIEHYLRRIL